MESVIVLGGAGFIGQHLVRWLDAHGAGSITIGDIARPSHPLPASARFVECDVRQPITLSASPETVLFNLAAIHRTPGHEDHEYIDTNVQGAHKVVAFCERSDIRRIFFTSSIAVYGPGEEPVTERTPPHPVSAYGYSKLEAEQIYTEWAEQHPGRQLVIARPGTVFGPGEGGNFTLLAEALAKRRFMYPGRRDTIKACGYVNDLLESMRFAEHLAKPLVTYNFGLAPPPTIADVCSAFCRVGQFPRPRVVVPTPLLLAVANVLTRLGASNFAPERVMKLVRSTHIIPQVLVDHGYPYQYDLEAALDHWYREEPRGRFV